MTPNNLIVASLALFFQCFYFGKAVGQIQTKEACVAYCLATFDLNTHFGQQCLALCNSLPSTTGGTVNGNVPESGPRTKETCLGICARDVTDSIMRERCDKTCQSLPSATGGSGQTSTGNAVSSAQRYANCEAECRATVKRQKANPRNSQKFIDSVKVFCLKSCLKLLPGGSGECNKWVMKLVELLQPKADDVMLEIRTKGVEACSSFQ